MVKITLADIILSPSSFQIKPHTVSKPPMDDNDDAFESLANIDISDIDFEDGSVGASHQVVNCPEEKKSKEVPQKRSSSAPGKL